MIWLRVRISPESRLEMPKPPASLCFQYRVLLSDVAPIQTKPYKVYCLGKVEREDGYSYCRWSLNMKTQHSLIFIAECGRECENCQGRKTCERTEEFAEAIVDTPFWRAAKAYLTSLDWLSQMAWKYHPSDYRFMVPEMPADLFWKTLRQHIRTAVKHLIRVTPSNAIAWSLVYSEGDLEDYLTSAVGEWLRAEGPRLAAIRLMDNGWLLDPASRFCPYTLGPPILTVRTELDVPVMEDEKRRILIRFIVEEMDIDDFIVPREEAYRIIRELVVRATGYYPITSAPTPKRDLRIRELALILARLSTRQRDEKKALDLYWFSVDMLASLIRRYIFQT